ncbi:MAG TPA: cob(I)yrinic acid a,c-diamide adenosyltransferase [Candidatus Nanoarchaeia archaeon]|nr:Cob(I)yrinic acid a,c-diamide adenosyltransferase [uncultured archaeon]
MTKKVRIYTKTGDKGETSLIGGQRVKKYDQRVWTIGALDELNANLGVASSQIRNSKINKLLEKIQNELFEVGAELADPNKAGNYFELGPEKITDLEAEIDSFDKRLPALKNFILPGGSPAASFLHQARSVCRRAERQLSLLATSTNINPNLVKYLNRLSDLLFVLARTANKGNKKPDKIWRKA